MKKVCLYLGLGSNLGDRMDNILLAVGKMDELMGMKCSAMSSIIETKSWGFDGGDFLNCAVRYDVPDVGQDPLLYLLSILHSLQKIEKSLGRDTVTKRLPGLPPEYHDRPIDIDILLYGDFKTDSAELTVPHPLIEQRPFVQGPLSEILSF